MTGNTHLAYDKGGIRHIVNPHTFAGMGCWCGKVVVPITGGVERDDSDFSIQSYCEQCVEEYTNPLSERTRLLWERRSYEKAWEIAVGMEGGYANSIADAIDAINARLKELGCEP